MKIDINTYIYTWIFIGHKSDFGLISVDRSKMWPFQNNDYFEEKNTTCCNL